MSVNLRGSRRTHARRSLAALHVGRMEFELFAREVPRTAENFRALCAGDRGVGRDTGAALDYTASKFHRIVPGFMAQVWGHTGD